MLDDAATEVLEDLTESVGWYATARLVAALGGQRLTVPATVAAAPIVVEAVGADKARALVAAMAGEVIDLPTAAAVRDFLADAREAANIAEMAAFGTETETIERWTNADRPAVERILEEHADLIAVRAGRR